MLCISANGGIHIKAITHEENHYTVVFFFLFFHWSGFAAVPVRRLQAVYLMCSGAVTLAKLAAAAPWRECLCGFIYTERGTVRPFIRAHGDCMRRISRPLE